MVYILSLFTVFFVGCQNKMRIKCENLNWREFGTSSATQAFQKEAALKKQVQACAKYNVYVDKTSYYEGFQDGLKTFCTTTTGYKIGTQGVIYKNTCPKENSRAFLRGYLKGRQVHLKEVFSQTKSLYSQAEERLWRKEREHTLVKSENPEEAKLLKDILDSYREETRSLAQKRLELKKELSSIKKQIAELPYEDMP